LNLAEVEEHLRNLRRMFPAPAAEIDDRLMPGPEFLYDPAYFVRSAQALEGDGLTMVEFPQHDARMVPASQQTYQIICEGKLAHDGDPVLARHVLNVIADQRPRGWRMSKPKGSKRKIDAAIAMAIAVFSAQAPSPLESVYETRGLVSI
jgi:phage terminase large subunit-like protein